MPKARIAFLIVAIWLLGCPLSVAQENSGIRVIRGTVESLNNSCAFDGPCSFSLQTETGVVSMVWNQGDVQPTVGCMIPNQVTQVAEHLKVGQKVEVHIAASSANNVLCGDKAAIILLPE